MRGWIIIGLCLLCGAQFGAGPSSPTRPLWDGKTWDFDTVSGTAVQVGEAINKDVQRLKLRCRDLEQNLAEEQNRLTALRNRRLALVHADTDYRSKKVEADRTEAALAAARREHNGVVSVSLSSQLNHLRQDMAAMESKGLGADSSIAECTAGTISYGKSLATFRDSLAQARKWRGDMTDSIRNSLRFRSPLRRGKVALLGPTRSTADLRSRVAEAAGERSASLAFENTVIAYAIDWGREISQAEKITTNEVTLEPFVAHVEGGRFDPKVALEVAEIDDYPPARVVIGRYTHVELVPRPDDPISQLMKAIGDEALDDADASAAATSARKDDPIVRAIREKRLVVGMSEEQAKTAMGGEGSVLSSAGGKKTIRWTTKTGAGGKQFEYARFADGKLVETWKK